VKIIKSYKTISTKSGDKGTSRNYSNEVLPKTNVLFDTLGIIDELSSFLGLTYHYSEMKKMIQHIQKDLQDINSVIATNQTDKNMDRIRKITTEDVEALESYEAMILEKCSIEARFVLPGSDSSLEGAYFDVCRSLARKVERQVITFKDKNSRDDLERIISYLNRLSDLLFICARSND
jgi:cob(I)alamin adenosyltransferase